MTNYYLTIDNGGTNTKVTIFDDNGSQISVSAFPTKGIERKAGFHEINLLDLKNKLFVAIKDALDKVNLSGNEIAGITTVGHGKGLYTLDKNNHVFMDGILSADNRATSYAAQFEDKVSEIYDISHQHVMPSQAPVILRWLKEHEPENYNKIGKILSNKDFIRFILTGEIKQEIGDASGNNFINLNTKQYDKRLFDFFEIPEMFDNMPSLVNATDQCGVVTSEVAMMTGLRADTPVFGGMFDIDACAIATGVLDNDKLSLIAGTWNMNTFADNKLAPLESGLMNSIFPTGKNLIEASSPTSAGNLSIIINMLLTSEMRDAKASGKSIYDNLEVFLENTDAKFAKVIFFPYLYGSNSDAKATASFIGLQSTTTKSELIRAVYEGIVFAHRYHVEQLLTVLGKKPSVIRMSGGGTNSSTWVQMFADILNLPIELVEANELGGLGGAMAVAVGLGDYATLEEAVVKMCHVKQRYEPQTDQTHIYDRKYAAFISLMNALDGNWELLKSFQEGE